MAETPESPIAPGSGRYASHEDDDGVSARVAAAFSLPDPSELPKRRALAWRVGDALRQIIERLGDTRAPDEDLASMAAELEGTAQRLAAFEHGRRYESWSEASTAGGSFAAPAVGGDSTADQSIPGPD